MIFTSFLATAFIFCLLFGTVPFPLAIAAAVVIGIIPWFARHHHDGYLTIDTIAHRSKLSQISPMLKFLTTMILMVLCVASNNLWTGVLTALIVSLIVVFIGGLKFHDYLAMLPLPLTFMLMSGLALLIQYGPEPSGIINLPLFQGYLYVSATAQVLTGHVMAKAFGAMSCLYLLSLTTPMTQIITVFKRLKVPSVVVQLMYLIYRCIFILFAMHHQMITASKSRLGYIDYKTSIRTTGNIYANLLIRSYKEANRMFDAMESRCFDGEINFLESTKVKNLRQLIMAMGMATFILAVTII